MSGARRVGLDVGQGEPLARYVASFPDSYTVIANPLVLKGQEGQQAFRLQLLGDRSSRTGGRTCRAD